MKRPVTATVLAIVIALSILIAAGCVKVNLPDSNKGPATIGSVAVATSVSADGQPLSVSNNFVANTPAIHVSIQVVNAPENTTVGTKWLYVKDDNGKAINQSLFQDSTTVKGTKYVAFNHPPASGAWAPGQYSISILLNNAETTTTSFTVQSVQKANVPAPTISFFTATPDGISSGQAVTLSWSTSGATTVTIAGMGNVPAVGNRVVVPVNSREYTLTAVNSAGSTELKVSINVTTYISDKPDLTIMDFWVEGTKAYYKIKNIGQTRVMPDAYTNPNAKPTLTYLYVEGNYRDSSRVEVLAPEEERTMSFPNYVWPYGTNRTYKIPIRICADGQDLINEYDKNNNCLVMDW
jgi:hypothetical protein